MGVKADEAPSGSALPVGSQVTVKAPPCSSTSASAEVVPGAAAWRPSGLRSRALSVQSRAATSSESAAFPLHLPSVKPSLGPGSMLLFQMSILGFVDCQPREQLVDTVGSLFIFHLFSPFLALDASCRDSL